MQRMGQKSREVDKEKERERKREKEREHKIYCDVINSMSICKVQLYIYIYIFIYLFIYMHYLQSAHKHQNVLLSIRCSYGRTHFRFVIDGAQAGSWCLTKRRLGHWTIWPNVGRGLRTSDGCCVVIGCDVFPLRAKTSFQHCIKTIRCCITGTKMRLQISIYVHKRRKIIRSKISNWGRLLRGKNSSIKFRPRPISRCQIKATLNMFKWKETVQGLSLNGQKTADWLLYKLRLSRSYNLTFKLDALRFALYYRFNVAVFLYPQFADR